MNYKCGVLYGVDYTLTGDVWEPVDQVFSDYIVYPENDMDIYSFIDEFDLVIASSVKVIELLVDWANESLPIFERFKVKVKESLESGTPYLIYPFAEPYNSIPCIIANLNNEESESYDSKYYKDSQRMVNYYIHQRAKNLGEPNHILYITDDHIPSYLTFDTSFRGTLRSISLGVATPKEE